MALPVVHARAVEGRRGRPASPGLPACHGALVAMSSFVAVVAVVRFFEGQALDVVPARQQAPGDRQIECPSCGGP